MKDKNDLLRELPKVDEIIRLMEPSVKGIPPATVKRVIQEKIDLCRQEILGGKADVICQKELLDLVFEKAVRENRYHLRRVINATGIILHTNLGRARLSPEAADIISSIATGCSNLEYNLESGGRGTRYEHVEELLKQVTGAEAALVVNNNAAAVLLILDTLAKGREVIVSRGELVEIGGSFRIPCIMERSGCRLVEVGTTNKTRISDYTERISENTGALLKVHTSNYRILGFTEEATLRSLWEAGLSRSIPVIYDMGSGLLAELGDFGIRGEPTVAQCVPYADILCFSGDKLLGGPQAGIIAGRRDFIDKMKKNNLLRALRIDKLTLAALEYTVRQYLEPEKAVENIPTLRMLTTSASETENKAKMLMSLLKEKDGLHYSIVDVQSQVGGGSMPDISLPSKAVGARSDKLSPNAIEECLRENDPPVIARVSKDIVLFDMLTVEYDEIPVITECLNRIFNMKKEGLSP